MIIATPMITAPMMNKGVDVSLPQANIKQEHPDDHRVIVTVAASDGPRASRPKRRIFTAEYKLRILEEYENAESPRDRAALLPGLRTKSFPLFTGVM